jgi:hypothetical protein
VYISEIAWMGTSNSANDEWVELHNSGSSAVSLDGWRLTDNASFDVTLEGAGSLAPGAFAVLERTDDNSAPGTAFFIYTGSLSNTGATLRLYDATGALVDQVAGGEDWSTIGGDNTTKETAQYTSSGWVTAAATPGSTNALVSSQVPEDAADPVGSTDSTSVTTSSRTTTNTASRNPRDSSQPLSLTLTAPSVGYVAQPITFTVAASGRGATASAGRYLTWNFGDTSTDTGSTATHQYEYPGTYIVSVRGRYEDDEVQVRHEITILPVALALTRNRAGAVQISNTAKYELALGDYTVVAGQERYTLPPDTYLKPNATITLPPRVFAAASEAVVAVHDQAAQVVAYQVPRAPRAAPPTAAPAPPTPAPRVAPTVAVNQPTPTSESFTFATTPTPRITATSTSTAVAATSPQPTAQTASVINAIPAAGAQSGAGEAAGPTHRPQNTTAYLALIGLLFLAIIALLSRRVMD